VLHTCCLIEKKSKTNLRRTYFHCPKHFRSVTVTPKRVNSTLGGRIVHIELVDYKGAYKC
jgi:hypothetical protein